MDQLIVNLQNRDATLLASPIYSFENFEEDYEAYHLFEEDRQGVHLRPPSRHIHTEDPGIPKLMILGACVMLCLHVLIFLAATTRW